MKNISWCPCLKVRVNFHPEENYAAHFTVRGQKLDYGDTREMLHLTRHNLPQTNILLSTVIESSEPLAHCHQINVKCKCHTL